jgi:hypothetical protein
MNAHHGDEQRVLALIRVHEARYTRGRSDLEDVTRLFEALNEANLRAYALSTTNPALSRLALETLQRRFPDAVGMTVKF